MTSKTIKLTGKALEVAKQMATFIQAAKDEAEEERKQYEASFEAMRQRNQAFLKKRWDSIFKMLKISEADQKKYALDVQYLSAHGDAFLVKEEEDQHAAMMEKFGVRHDH